MRVDATVFLATIGQDVLKQNAHALGTSSPTLGSVTYAMKAPEGNNMCAELFIAVCVRQQKPGNNLKFSLCRTDGINVQRASVAANSSSSVPFSLAHRNSISFRYPFPEKGDLQSQLQRKTYVSPK